MKAEVVSMTADKLDMEAIRRGGEILKQGILSRKILWSVCHCAAAEQYLAIQCFLLSQSHDRCAAWHVSRRSHDCICYFILLSAV